MPFIEDGIVYIIKNFRTDEIVGWTLCKDYLKSFLKYRKSSDFITITKIKESDLSNTPFFHINDTKELILYKGFVIRHFEYLEILKNIEFMQMQLMNKLEEFYSFTRIFKLKEKHRIIIDKAMQLIFKYIQSDDFNKRVKIKDYVRYYIETHKI